MSSELAVVIPEAPQPPAEIQAQADLMQPVTLDNLIERVNLIKAAMKRCMVEGQHYGTIPGTKKPSLWKPGAELICTLFQLGTRYPNHANQVERENGHFTFTLTCELFHIPTGRAVGEGVGACSTMEYRYRVQTEDKIYSDTGKTVPAKYTPYDFYNTALKIGKKRSLVDAVLTVTGASKIFNQDTEDDPEKHQDVGQSAARTGDWNQRESRRPLPQRPPPAAPKGNGNGKNHDTGQREDIAGMVDRAWPNDYQGKRYYFAKVNGQQLQTTDPQVGEQLLNAVHRVVIATVEPAPNKPGKYYVKALDVPEVPQTTQANGDAPLDEEIPM